jgi:phage terminase small subunit
LQLAAEAWDAIRDAREDWEKAGRYQISSRGAYVPHPAIKVERDAVRAWIELLKALDLGVDLPDPIEMAAI